MNASTASGSLTAIRKAAANRDAAATREALLTWGRGRWPENPPMHLSDIAAREPTVAQAIEDLQRCLYGRGGESWSPDALLTALAALPAASMQTKAAAREALQPLFNSRR